MFFSVPPQRNKRKAYGSLDRLRKAIEVITIAGLAGQLGEVDAEERTISLV